jgi:GH24 family phage-related lysozyme (muramidase)
MPSLLEIYKAENSRQDKDNLEELTKLYNENRAYQSKYSFNNFVSVATKNSDAELDDSILEILNPPIQETDEVVARPKATMMGANVLSLLPKDVKRTIAGIGDMAFRGTVNAASDAANMLNTFGQNKLIEQQAKSSGEDVSTVRARLEQRQRQRVKEVVAPVGKAVFGEDIYDGVNIQDPESITGSIVKPFGAFIATLTNLPKLATKGLTKVDDIVGPFANKMAQKQAIKQVTKNNRKKIAGQLARAEVASQVVFEDDPEFLMVAGGINSLLKEHELDDSTLGAVINWLDADENDTAAQRRLSLLLDGGVFTGGLYAAGKIIGGTAKGSYNAALSTIKNNPKAVEAIKARLKPLMPSTSKVDDVFVEAEGSDLKTNAMNFFRKVRRQFGTSRGYKSEEMYEIFNASKAAKDAWELQAKNIFDTLSGTMKKLAKDKNINSKDMNDMLEKYFQGSVKLNTLPETLQPIAKEAKGQIKYLSNLMLENDSVPKELKNVIELNMGKYLRKTYELYDNKNYKPSDEVKNNAVEYLTGVLSNAPIQARLFGEPAKRLSVPEAKQKAEEIVRDILQGGKGEKGIAGDATDHLNKVFGANKAEVIFASRKDIDEPLRKLMGEVTEDTSQSVFRTLTKLSQYLADTKLYDELYESGAGKWFYDDVNILPVGSGLKRTEGTIVGEGFGKLNGMRTTKQLADYFTRMSEIKSKTGGQAFVSTLLTAKGFGQAFQTVYSVTTHARNTIGGGLIMASNGMNPFDKETANAFRTLKNEIARSSLGKDKKLQQEYLKYRRLGLVNQNVRAGEFNQLINEAADVNWVQRADETFKSKAYNSTKKLIKDTHSKIQEVYVAEDDLWRIASFQKELKTLQKAYPNKLIADLEKEAAAIIRNTMPTYDMVPEGAKALRRYPIGNFYSFTAERFRNNYHTIMQGRKEVLSGNDVLVQRGLNRLAAKTVIGAGGAKTVSEFTKFAYGITQEEEDAIRNVSTAPWSRNSTLAFSRDKYGNIQYVDLSYTDPDSPVLDVLKAGLNSLFDPDVPDAALGERLIRGLMIDPALALLKPFYSEALLTTATIEAYTGRDENGRPIDGYNEENDALTNGMAIMNHIFYERLTPAQLRESVDKIGDKDTDWAEYITSELTGQTFYTINAEKLEKDLSFKMLDLKQGQRSAYNIFDKNIKDSTTTEELLNSYLDANRAYYRTAVRARKAIEGAKFLNVSYDTIDVIVQDTVSGGRFTKAETMDLITGGTDFSPLRVSKASLKKIYDQSDFVNINFQDFQNQYNLMYSKLSRLPLIEIKEFDDETQEALDMVKAPVRDVFRMRKVVGGLVEGKDTVPYTKEDPADRVNPYTGKPYQKQMDRLGFDKGGVVDDELLNFILATEDVNLYKDYRKGNLDKVVKAHEGSERFQKEHGKKDKSTIGGITESKLEKATIGQTVNMVKQRLAEERKYFNSIIPEEINNKLPVSVKNAAISLMFNVGKDAFINSNAYKNLAKGNIDGFYKEAFDPQVGFVKITGADKVKRVDDGLVNRRKQEQQLAVGTWQDPFEKEFNAVSEADLRYLPSNVSEKLKTFKSPAGEIYLPRAEAASLNREIKAEKMSEAALRNDPQGRGFNGGSPEYDPRSITNDPAEIKGRQGLDEYGTRPKIYRAIESDSAIFSSKYDPVEKPIGQFYQGTLTRRGSYKPKTDELLLQSTSNKEGKELIEPHEYMHRGLQYDRSNVLNRIAGGVDAAVYKGTGGNLLGTYLTGDQQHDYIDKAFEQKELDDFNRQVEKMSPTQLKTLGIYLESEKAKLTNK